MALSLTQKWLSENIGQYANPQLIYNHVDSALQLLPTLRIKSAVYTYDDGRTMLLLCIHGLLPIKFRGKEYHIPINIWIPKGYADERPIVYVVPTSNMLVKVGKSVDHSGRVDVEWTRRSGEKARQSTIVDLVNDLGERFGTDPPVYAKPTQATPATPSTRSITPVPPPRIHQPQPRQSAPPVSTPASPVPASAPPPPPPPPLPPPNILDCDEPPPPVAAAARPPRPPNPYLLSLHGSLHEKLTSSISSLYSSLSHNGDRLRTIQSQLLSGPPAIRDEESRLNAVKTVCNTVSKGYMQAIQQAENNIHLLKSRGEPEVDQLVCSTGIVYNQLVDLIAEDNGIEDSMYHLHRALCTAHTAIDLDKFLRHIRIQAEQQFMKRALIEKIQGGLPRGGM